MTNSTAEEATVLQHALDTRAQLADIEARWKQLRADSRRYAVELMFDHGYSISRTSTITGHHRQTLKMWAEIEAARLGRTEEA